MSDILQKISDGEGLLLLENEGWVTANYHAEMTDPNINPDTYEYWQSLTVLQKPIANDYKIVSDELILKTENDKKIEKLTQLQGMVLTKLKDVNIAIATQGETNKVKVKKGKAEVFTISEDDIEIIGDYQNAVTTFHETFNPDDYELEEITIDIFNGGLELPEILTRLGISL